MYMYTVIDRLEMSLYIWGLGASASSLLYVTI